MELPKDHDWRHESGLLISGVRQVNASATARIWTDGQFRLFLSHKSEVKQQAHAVKEALQYYGVAAFVAHDDISPTMEWQEEIENALATMDGFVALLTWDFRDSNWTNQEIGYAVARGVPIIGLRLGLDPYGFLAKFQALRASSGLIESGGFRFAIR
jgi:hypothetical protein